ncbi:MAG: LolA family protein [Acidobacteriaceae bacterium]
MILHAHTRSYEIAGFRRYAFFATLFLILNILGSGKVFAAAAPVKSTVPPMTLAQVVDTLVARNAARARDLTSYQGSRTYTVTYRGFPGDLLATMVVDMNYDAPNTKEFRITSQSGPKWLVDRVLKRLVKSESDAQQDATRKAVDLNQKNYSFSDLEYEPAADGCSYVVSVEPKHPNKYLYRGKIWINDRDFAVCRIQAQPAKNPSFWITSTTIAQTYEKVGEFWLPQKNKSVSAIRLGGRATLTIQYQDYKVPPPIDVAHASLSSPPAAR